MDVSGQLHVLADLPQQRTPVPIKKETVQTPEVVWTFWTGNININVWQPFRKGQCFIREVVGITG